MKISCLKYKKDNTTFQLLKTLGIDVFEIDDLEQTDKAIENIINKNYNTIIISNEVASFSEDIMTKYNNKNKDINIIITKSKNNGYSV